MFDAKQYMNRRMTEAEARRFLQDWPKWFRSGKLSPPQFFHDLNEFPGLDPAEFFLTCLKHRNPVVRLEAVRALAARNEKLDRPEGVGELRRIMLADPDPALRGEAADALGRLAGRYELLGILSDLLSLVQDGNQPNRVRIDAYKGLLQCSDQVPAQRPWQLDYKRPAVDQLDWGWIEELAATVGSA